MKRLQAVILCLFTNFLFAQNVIIVVIDGARYTETFGGGNTYIPHLYDDLRPSGYIYTNFRIADEGRTETNPGHSSMLTGTWQQIANDGSERPDKPTLFEYFRMELTSNDTDNYIIGGKAKLDILAYSSDPGYGSGYGAIPICADVSDIDVYNNLIAVMDTISPNLILASFSDTDRQGHTGVFSNYVSALTNADNLIYQLWQHIQAEDYGYTTTNTTMFVTNDHGRHDDAHGGFTNHGDDCEGCEHIMLFAIGKNVTSGVENSDLHYQIDIAPTVGHLLGFSTPRAIGVSLYEGINPLPVELVFFTAKFLKSGGVKLNWQTKTEVNNYGFEVERSQMSNDKSQTEWTKLGFVEGNGNSNSPKDYTFTDNNAQYGSYAYRLKQIDTDGQFEYSDVIEVDAGSIPNEIVLEQNYPNPFNPSTTIKFALAETQNAKLVVYDVLGNQVALPFNGTAEGGKIYEAVFNAENFSSGIYFYRLETKEKVENMKMLLLK